MRGAQRVTRIGLLLLLLPALGLESALLAQPSAALGVDENALLGAPAGSPLSGVELDSTTREIAGNLRCPVCQGLSVADSPSPSAIAMLSQVRDLVAEGYTGDQIFAYFESTYGEFVRLTPRADGFNLVVWIAPILILLTGAAILFARLRRTTTATAAAREPEALDPYLEKVRAELSAAVKPEEAPQE